MGQPGQLGAQFGGDDAIIRRLQDLERIVRELSAGNQFAPMGISPQPQGLVVSGNMEITGTLSLPAGIINNDALAAPVSPAASHAENWNFGITTSMAEKTRVTIPVPTGFTRALVHSTVTISAYNGTASDDNLYASCRIQGTAAGTAPGLSVKTLYTGAVSDSDARLLTGISGSIYTAGYASTFTGTWATESANIMNVSMMALFLR